MNEAFRKRIINKPRKLYYCELCGLLIEGKHFYVSGITDGDLFYYRSHIKCREILEKEVECSKCSLGFYNECTTNHASDCLKEARKANKP